MSLDRQWHNHRLTLQSQNSKSAAQEDQGRNDFKLRLGGGVGRVVGAGWGRGVPGGTALRHMEEQEQRL